MGRLPDASPRAALETLIEVIYPKDPGALGIRGSLPPLSWETTTPPERVEGDACLFRLSLPEGELLELKVARGEDWALGHNYMVHAGEHLHIEPTFDQRTARLDAPLELEGHRVEVLLPPGYDEHPQRRYPVLYALDGQSLWTESKDPFGVWSLDATVTELCSLAAIDELLIVGIHTAHGRLDDLGPVADPTYGGGHADDFLRRLVEGLKPAIDARYRTLPGREDTGVVGSSMGGLFAFYAAWTLPDVFGKAACLSSSFWWNDRWAVKLVQSTPLPEPRPKLYLDSGAARSEFDLENRDTYHHTRSMLRALTRAGFDVGNEVHRLVFPGQPHHASSWASRIALPLQLLFPRTPRPFDHARWGLIDEGAP